MSEPRDAVVRARELLAGITPGEWTYDEASECVTATEWHSGEQLTWVVMMSPNLPLGALDLARIATGKFVAAAPTLLTELADEVEAGRKERERVRTDVEKLMNSDFLCRQCGSQKK